MVVNHNVLPGQVRHLLLPTWPVTLTCTTGDPGLCQLCMTLGALLARSSGVRPTMRLNTPLAVAVPYACCTRCSRRAACRAIHGQTQHQGQVGQLEPTSSSSRPSSYTSHKPGIALQQFINAIWDAQSSLRSPLNGHCSQFDTAHTRTEPPSSLLNGTATVQCCADHQLDLEGIGAAARMVGSKLHYAHLSTGAATNEQPHLPAAVTAQAALHCCL